MDVSSSWQAGLRRDNQKDVLSLALNIAMNLFEPMKRDLHAFEGFSGKGGITSALLNAGFEAAQFDRATRHWSEDITKLSGLAFFFLQVLRIENRGMLWLAPQCSSWITMARGSTLRHSLNKFFGNEDRQDVFEANFTGLILSA